MWSPLCLLVLFIFKKSFAGRPNSMMNSSSRAPSNLAVSCETVLHVWAGWSQVWNMYEKVYDAVLRAQTDNRVELWRWVTILHLMDHLPKKHPLHTFCWCLWCYQEFEGGDWVVKNCKLNCLTWKYLVFIHTREICVHKPFFRGRHLSNHPSAHSR